MPPPSFIKTFQIYKFKIESDKIWDLNLNFITEDTESNYDLLTFESKAKTKIQFLHIISCFCYLFFFTKFKS